MVCGGYRPAFADYLGSVSIEEQKLSEWLQAATIRKPVLGGRVGKASKGKIVLLGSISFLPALPISDTSVNWGSRRC